MGEFEDIEGSDAPSELLPVTASVSSAGQVTIPETVRQQLDLCVPDRVVFQEIDDGRVVVERLPSAEEMTGFAARTGDASTEKPASELLREKRATGPSMKDPE